MATPDNSSPDLKQAARFAVLVALVVGGLGVLAAHYRDRIERNDKAWLAERITRVLPPGSFDNDPMADEIQVSAPDRLGTALPVSVYRARLRGNPTAAVILSVAPEGYGGPLQLLVAISHGGSVIAVQVLEHSETHGLGDAFAADAAWLASFAGRSLPALDTGFTMWKVRKDGGDFDQFTGATVTPRAIIKAVQRTLEYHQVNRNALYATPAR